MTDDKDSDRRIYVGTHDGVCALNTFDGGLTWNQGEMTPLANAAARLSVSPVDPDRAYLAAYEAGVFRTDDGGGAWSKLSSYPTGYCPRGADSAGGGNSARKGSSLDNYHFIRLTFPAMPSWR